MANQVQQINQHLRGSFRNVVLERGGRLYKNGYIKDAVYYNTTKQIVASVNSESFYLNTYEVTIDYFPEEQEFTSSCNCMYGNHCKHAAAVFIYITEALRAGKISYFVNPEDLVINLLFFEDNDISQAAGETMFEKGKKLANGHNRSELVKPGEYHYECNEKNKLYTVILKNEKNSSQIHTSCNCKDTVNTLCVHKTAALFSLQKAYGKYGLFFTHDYEAEIQPILKNFGFSPSDDYHEVLSFGFQDSMLKGFVHNEKFLHPHIFEQVSQVFSFNPLHSLPAENMQRQVTGYVFRFKDYHDGQVFSFEAAIGKRAKNSEKMIGSPEITDQPLYHEAWRENADNDDYEIARLIDNHTSFVNTSDHHTLCKELERYKTIFNFCKYKRLFVTTTSNYYNKTKATELQECNVSASSIQTRLKCRPKGALIAIQLEFVLGDKTIEINNTYDKSGFFVDLDHTFYLWHSVYDYKAFMIANGEQELLTATVHWPNIWKDWLRELSNHIHVDIDPNIQPFTQMKIQNKQPKVFLKEEGNFLLIYPAIGYNDSDIHILDKGTRFFTDKNEIILRDHQEESRIIDLIASTHGSFNKHTFQSFFFLVAEKVLENTWFTDFYGICKKEGIDVYGIEKLRKIKYYPGTPTINYSFNSGTDWFDIEVKIQFDEFRVSLADVRKAIIDKKDYVKLSNEKLALLPEEWIKKFAALLSYGKVDKDHVKLKKNQFALVHDLYNQIDNIELQQEFAVKKALLNDKTEIEAVIKPRTIKAKLRDYQSVGLNWLALLYNTGLGGCLADDMGLGKTIQMLSVFSYAKEKNNGIKITNLVVCPTSLVFNWKNEIEKFIPTFKVMVHWSNNRDMDSKTWKKYDLVITTYGTLVNDIEWIRKFNFHIATLDESQAIKNPTSLRYKAVNLITAKQKYVMTGTPIENNTMELYAQMHFINPGILGSLNGFRKEFSANIDKERDIYKVEQLKKLVNPFIIRRKKEEVAKELPEKTEQILVCQMSPEQMGVYEAFKNDIRQKIMDGIEVNGLNKSRLTVLEGLTKLRQICDSPALVNAEEDYGTASVKADELIRLISEKTGNHKTLVFSQFLGMLDLIEKRLIENNIQYVKLTGSSTNRQELVDQFENNEKYRVFLLSLKAGGVGLNLVSADYVFLVDPWWNPAVEKQAIDRAHRIGQTKKVFAYRMICENTIEEKILELQEKKKTLADDIINSEKGFVSELTQSDLEILLS